MGKKPQRHDWREAKHLCRLNQSDIAMAKALGFRPDALIRARPDPKQKWKLPVKYWIRELHLERFGHVIGEEAVPAPQPQELAYDEEAVRIYVEERKPRPAAATTITHDEYVVAEGITDADVPF
jgi:hypothetical protein